MQSLHVSYPNGSSTHLTITYTMTSKLVSNIGSRPKANSSATKAL